jgi:hypothetical protein
MYKRTLVLGWLVISTVGSALCADAIAIDNSRPLGQLVVRLWEQYGYLVTYEDAPVDPDREIVTKAYAPDRIDRFAVSKPITFHLARGQSANPGGDATGAIAAEPILPLSQELMQPLIDEYNASGNPSRFAVAFDGTYAYIYAVSHMVNGKMEDFQPILATKVSMPPQTTPCYETLNNLFAELKKTRNVDVARGMIDANFLYRLQCTIVGSDLTARDVLAQIAHKFGTDNGVGRRAPGEELRIAWSLLYYIPSAQYVLSMNWVPDKAPPQSKPAVLSIPASSGGNEPPAKGAPQAPGSRLGGKP